MNFWHRLLVSLGIRNDFDYVPPAWPEVNHMYEQDATSNCCHHCGGGKLHAIHRQPWDLGRMAEIAAHNSADLEKRAAATVEFWKSNHPESQ